MVDWSLTFGIYKNVSVLGLIFLGSFNNAFLSPGDSKEAAYFTFLFLIGDTLGKSVVV